MLHRFLPMLVGIVLIFAGSFKAIELFGLPDPLSLFARAGLAFVSGIEIAIGACLIAALWPHPVRRLAMLLFALFMGYAILQEFAGAKSCGCLGKPTSTVVDRCLGLQHLGSSLALAAAVS